MTNTTKKVSKKESLSALISILNVCEDNGIALDMGEITYESLRGFINNEIGLLKKKAETAKARAAEKKRTGDETREKVYSVLTDEFMTIEQIVAAIGQPDIITNNVVISRLTQLGAKGTNQVEKGEVTISTSDGKSRKVSGYRKISA